MESLADFIRAQSSGPKSPEKPSNAQSTTPSSRSPSRSRGKKRSGSNSRSRSRDGQRSLQWALAVANTPVTTTPTPHTTTSPPSVTTSAAVRRPATLPHEQESPVDNSTSWVGMGLVANSSILKDLLKRTKPEPRPPLHTNSTDSAANHSPTPPPPSYTASHFGLSSAPSSARPSPISKPPEGVPPFPEILSLSYDPSSGDSEPTDIPASQPPQSGTTLSAEQHQQVWVDLDDVAFRLPLYCRAVQLMIQRLSAVPRGGEGYSGITQQDDWEEKQETGSPSVVRAPGSAVPASELPQLVELVSDAVQQDTSPVADPQGSVNSMVEASPEPAVAKTSPVAVTEPESDAKEPDAKAPPAVVTSPAQKQNNGPPTAGPSTISTPPLAASTAATSTPPPTDDPEELRALREYELIERMVMEEAGSAGGVRAGTPGLTAFFESPPDLPGQLPPSQQTGQDGDPPEYVPSPPSAGSGMVPSGPGTVPSVPSTASSSGVVVEELDSPRASPPPPPPSPPHSHPVEEPNTFSPTTAPTATLTVHQQAAELRAQARTLGSKLALLDAQVLAAARNGYVHAHINRALVTRIHVLRAQLAQKGMAERSEQRKSAAMHKALSHSVELASEESNEWQEAARRARGRSDRLARDNFRLQTAVAAHRDQMAEMRSEVRALYSQLQRRGFVTAEGRWSDKDAKLRTRITSLDSALTVQREAAGRLKRELGDVQSELSEEREQARQLRLLVGRTEQEALELREQLDQWRQQAEAGAERIKQLEAENAKLESQRKKQGRLIEQSEMSVQRCQTLASERDALELKVQILSAQLHQDRDSEEQRGRTLALLRKQLEQLETSDQRRVAAVNEEWKIKLLEVQMKNRALQAERDDLERLVTVGKHTNSELLARVESQRAQLSDWSQLQNQVLALQARCARLDEELSAAAQCNSALRESECELATQLQEHRTRMVELETRMSEGAERQGAERVASQNELSRAHQTIAQGNSRTQQLQDALASSQKELKGVRATYAKETREHHAAVLRLLGEQKRLQTHLNDIYKFGWDPRVQLVMLKEIHLLCKAFKHLAEYRLISKEMARLVLRCRDGGIASSEPAVAPALLKWADAPYVSGDESKTSSADRGPASGAGGDHAQDAVDGGIERKTRHERPLVPYMGVEFVDFCGQLSSAGYAVCTEYMHLGWMKPNIPDKGAESSQQLVPKPELCQVWESPFAFKTPTFKSYVRECAKDSLATYVGHERATNAFGVSGGADMNSSHSPSRSARTPAQRPTSKRTPFLTGVEITSVTRGSPGHRAGMRVGDVVLHCAGKSVRCKDVFRWLVTGGPRRHHHQRQSTGGLMGTMFFPGDVVCVSVLRRVDHGPLSASGTSVSSGGTLTSALNQTRGRRASSGVAASSGAMRHRPRRMSAVVPHIGSSPSGSPSTLSMSNGTQGGSLAVLPAARSAMQGVSSNGNGAVRLHYPWFPPSLQLERPVRLQGRYTLMCLTVSLGASHLSDQASLSLSRYLYDSAVARRAMQDARVWQTGQCLALHDVQPLQPSMAICQQVVNTLLQSSNIHSLLLDENRQLLLAERYHLAKDSHRGNASTDVSDGPPGFEDLPLSLKQYSVYSKRRMRVAGERKHALKALDDLLARIKDTVTCTRKNLGLLQTSAQRPMFPRAVLYQIFDGSVGSAASAGGGEVNGDTEEVAKWSVVPIGQQTSDTVTDTHERSVNDTQSADTGGGGDGDGSDGVSDGETHPENVDRGVSSDGAVPVKASADSPLPSSTTAPDGTDGTPDETGGIDLHTSAVSEGNDDAISVASAGEPGDSDEKHESPSVEPVSVSSPPPGGMTVTSIGLSTPRRRPVTSHTLQTEKADDGTIRRDPYAHVSSRLYVSTQSSRMKRVDADDSLALKSSKPASDARKRKNRSQRNSSARSKVKQTVQSNRKVLSRRQTRASDAMEGAYRTLLLRMPRLPRSLLVFHNDYPLYASLGAVHEVCFNTVLHMWPSLVASHHQSGLWRPAIQHSNTTPSQPPASNMSVSVQWPVASAVLGVGKRGTGLDGWRNAFMKGLYAMFVGVYGNTFLVEKHVVAVLQSVLLHVPELAGFLHAIRSTSSSSSGKSTANVATDEVTARLSVAGGKGAKVRFSQLSHQASLPYMTLVEHDEPGKSTSGERKSRKTRPLTLSSTFSPRLAVSWLCRALAVCLPVAPDAFAQSWTGDGARGGVSCVSGGAEGWHTRFGQAFCGPSRGLRDPRFPPIHTVPSFQLFTVDDTSQVVLLCVRMVCEAACSAKDGHTLVRASSPAKSAGSKRTPGPPSTPKPTGKQDESKTSGDKTSEQDQKGETGDSSDKQTNADSSMAFISPEGPASAAGGDASLDLSLDVAEDDEKPQGVDFDFESLLLGRGGSAARGGPTGPFKGPFAALSGRAAMGLDSIAARYATMSNFVGGRDTASTRRQKKPSASLASQLRSNDKVRKEHGSACNFQTVRTLFRSQYPRLHGHEGPPKGLTWSEASLLALLPIGNAFQVLQVLLKDLLFMPTYFVDYAAHLLETCMFVCIDEQCVYMASHQARLLVVQQFVYQEIVSRGGGGSIASLFRMLQRLATQRRQRGTPSTPEVPTSPGDDTLSITDIVAGVKTFWPSVPTELLSTVLHVLDVDGNGFVEYAEFQAAGSLKASFWVPAAAVVHATLLTMQHYELCIYSLFGSRFSANAVTRSSSADGSSNDESNQSGEECGVVLKQGGVVSLLTDLCVDLCASSGDGYFQITPQDDLAPVCSPEPSHARRFVRRCRRLCGIVDAEEKEEQAQSDAGMENEGPSMCMCHLMRGCFAFVDLEYLQRLTPLALVYCDTSVLPMTAPPLLAPFSPAAKRRGRVETRDGFATGVSGYASGRDWIASYVRRCVFNGDARSVYRFRNLDGSSFRERMPTTSVSDSQSSADTAGVEGWFSPVGTPARRVESGDSGTKASAEDAEQGWNERVLQMLCAGVPEEERFSEQPVKTSVSGGAEKEQSTAHTDIQGQSSGDAAPASVPEAKLVGDDDEIELDFDEEPAEYSP